MSILSEKPKVVILLTPDMRSKLIPASAEKRLAQVADVRAPQEGELTSENLPGLLDGAVAAITGWGTPASRRSSAGACDVVEAGSPCCR